MLSILWHLHGSSNSFLCKLHICAVLLETDIVAFCYESGYACGAASHKRIEHDISGKTVELDETTGKFKWKRRRMTDPAS
jgi:hypothetical protein